ncbi:M36 family metallopeptidase [Parasediminibacterium sp. JCM 36343]|uniref:M36 family metallopeptidase n=1 Tax=Parasediminibacterium sp. JCM 36343 TaxID=3374279 RepID=UPI00397998CA
MKISTLPLLLLLLASGSLFAQNISSKEVGKLLSNTSIAKKSSTEYVVSNAYEDAQLGLKHVYLQQAYKGIKVYTAIQSMVFKNDTLQYQTSSFIPDIASKAGSATPVVSALHAIGDAATYLGLSKPVQLSEIKNSFDANNKIIFSPAGIAKQNIATELVWASYDNGKTVQLAWNISIDVAGSDDYWNVRINAINGQFINKDNYTVYENTSIKKTTPVKKKDQKENTLAIADNATMMGQHITDAPPPGVTTASYNVVPYPLENRFVGSIALETDPWLKAGIGNNAITYGWNYDGATAYNYTRGNNVYAYEDSLKKNAPGRPALSTTALPTLSFNYTPDFTLQPTDPNNRQFATTNMFYWNNIMHDLYYQYGFTEAAGNFQNDNISRGGVGTDYVKAEAQDGGGTNNANFSTPPDGSSGRMQMYLYNAVFSPLTITKPAYLAGIDSFKEGVVSVNNSLRKVGPITGQVVLYYDNAAGTVHQGCAAATNNISGKIAFLNSSSCTYASKIKNAQNAGAIAVIVGRTSGPALLMGGNDSSIVIPAIMISSTDGNKIIAALNKNDTVNATIAPGVRFDGALDNSIVSHEYTHGISNRLTGGGSNTSCLSNKEQGGEGWSDYSGLMMTTDWATAQLTDGTKVRAHGQYASSQIPGGLGNRVYPYSTDMSIDPHTYKDLTNVLYNGEVHYIGEVWCSALWDMTWNIIQQEGTINSNLYNPAAGGGNAIALQLMVTGLTLQKCRPGFLDSRDAILAADSILYGFKHKCSIWNAFARRGMGLSAVQGLSDSTNDQVPAFDVPVCLLPLHLLGFKASQSGKGIQLEWNNAEEINTKLFTVEYSTDGNNWSLLASVPAKNTSGANSYTFFHAAPAEGSNYYRLKMTDINGSFAYSNISTVNIGSKAAFSIYPNPVKAKLSVQWASTKAENSTLLVTDMQGKILQQQPANVQKGNNLFILNTALLAKGTYILMIKGEKTTQQVFVKE